MFMLDGDLPINSTFSFNLISLKPRSEDLACLDLAAEPVVAPGELAVWP